MRVGTPWWLLALFAAAVPLATACTPEPRIEAGTGSPDLSATELLKRIKEVSEFHRSFVLFRFPMDQSCAEQVALEQYRRR